MAETEVVKVWADDESEPPDQEVTNLATCPRNWLREEPEYAAELYGLERGVGEYRVRVRDENGVVHVFDVKVVREIRTSVRFVA